jgi:two-component system sensor histidine kinase PilS (NtrC family)
VPVGALATRLVAIGALFALAVALEVGGRVPYSERQLVALHAVVLAGFLGTLAQGLLAAYGGGRPALLELAGDGMLITALVYCTGGPRSVFGFVYVVWIVYAALRAGSRGAALAPAAAFAGYALVTWGVERDWLPALEMADRVGSSVLLSDLGTHAVAFVLVAALAHRLARQIKRGERELHELGELQRRIFDNVSSGLLTVDLGGSITSFNREAARITGLPGSAAVGTRLEAAFPDIAEAIAASPVAAEPDEQGLSRLCIRFENRRGEPLYLGLSCSTLRDEEGQPEGQVVIFQDLTRVTEMEEELQRSERLAAVGQLAAGLAHEVRNPLGSLSGAIELLAAELPAPDPASRRLLRIVQRETTRLDGLVSDFLAYARPGELRHERCALDELLRDLAALFTEGEHRHVALDLDLEDRLVTLGDPDALRQVLWNLLLNAAQAEPADGRVRVTARRASDAKGSWIRVEVRDTGKGIEPAILERIFEPFFTTRAKGTGLGLATVHRLVEAHGGSVQIASEVGTGTTVAVVVPAA